MEVSCHSGSPPRELRNKQRIAAILRQMADALGGLALIADSNGAATWATGTRVAAVALRLTSGLLT